MSALAHTDVLTALAIGAPLHQGADSSPDNGAHTHCFGPLPILLSSSFHRGA